MPSLSSFLFSCGNRLRGPGEGAALPVRAAALAGAAGSRTALQPAASPDCPFTSDELYWAGECCRPGSSRRDWFGLLRVCGGSSTRAGDAIDWVQRAELEAAAERTLARAFGAMPK